MQIEGLDEFLQEYFEKGITPDDIPILEMIKEVRTQNFIPEDTEDLYRQALLREYKSYHNAQKK